MMKKIIAAALSVLLGAFGYTIVDKTLEQRVATLESEVVELREKVSRYYIEEETSSCNSTFTTTNRHIIPTKLNVGDHLIESPESRHIFLLRKYDDGKVRFYPPNGSPVTLPYFQTVVSQYNIKSLRAKTISTEAQTTTSYNVSTTIPTYEEYYLYITESAAQISDIDTDTSYKVMEDKNYSQVSFPIETTKTTITISCKGYTDPVFAGRKIRFYYSAEAYSEQYINNTINVDGSFEYQATYLINYIPYSNNTYGFGTVYID